VQKLIIAALKLLQLTANNIWRIMSGHHAAIVSRKQRRTCSQRRFKTRISRKTASKLKLHNFKLTGWA
jgi:hypothetical protein